MMKDSNPEHSFLRYVLATALVGFIVANLAHAAPPARDVNVVNTPDVNVVNTPDVNVANTPDVNIANTPTVDVNSLPAVQLAPGVTFRDRDNPALQPIQFTCEVFLDDTVQISDTTCINESSLTGKTLVIEYINAVVAVPTGQRPEMRVSVTNEDADGAISSQAYRYRFEDCGPVGGNTCHWLDREVRLYHSRFNIVVTFTRSSPWTGAVTLSARFS